MPTMMAVTQRPVWLGMVVTPWLTPLAFIPLYAAFYTVMGDNRPGMSWFGSLIFSYAFGIPLGYAAMLLLGWPWVALLRRWHKLSVGLVCLGASVIGAVMFVALVRLVGNYRTAALQAGQQAVMGLVLGLLSGLIFCAVAGVPIKATPHPSTMTK